MDEPPSKAFFEILFSSNSLAVGLNVVAVAVMLALSIFAVASESIFFSLKKRDLQLIDNSANTREKIISYLLATPRSLFSSIVIFAYFANSAFTSGALLLFFNFNGNRVDAWISISVVVILTFVLCILGVVLPVMYVNKNNLKLTTSVAGIWNKLLPLFSPLTNLLFFSRNRLDGETTFQKDHSVVLGLNEALERAADDEKSTEDEREILKGIVNFGSLTVKQVMRSRVDIAALDIDLNFHELMNLINKSGFSRMPVYRDTLDRIEGVLYIKDLLPFIDHDEGFKWQKLIRPGFFVPENKKIDVLLKDFQKRHVHISIVVDEYGGTLGLITLEDIIEEIIGDINDEFDDEMSHFRKINENTFVFEGKTSLHDFCKVVEVDVELFEEVKGESESLGGLILELNNELPNVGKKISFEQFTFVIEAVDKKRIKRVRVNVHEQKES